VTPEQQARFDEDGSRPQLRNPFEHELRLELAHAATGARLSPHGFYDGQGVFRARFSAPRVGAWAWRTASSLPALDGHAGELSVTNGSAKGCPKAGPNKVGFVYPDGSPYWPVGTTCYAWVHQSAEGAEGDPDALEERTLASLKASPFNKVRMTGYPKWYPFTHHEPRYYPFMGNGTEGSGGSWDFTRPNPEFWQHYEQRVAAVAALGIVPEIILFHPYDGGHWGFDRMNTLCGKAGSTSASHCTGPGEDKDCLWCDENYIKTMVARVSAFGTWWSMANEWDLEKSKTVADWDQLFQTLQSADAAHDRERSIHNCQHYYNHSRPWVSHVSLQGHSVNQLDMAKATWTSVTPKPIVWDEVEYEGNISYGWGALTGYTEARRAWTALTNQVAMAGHSNTNLGNRDRKECLGPNGGWNPGMTSCNAVMWWNKGDILGGDSPDRLEFYRQYISGELGVKVPALEDATVRAIPGRLSALSVFL
jgi:hypothetical protein